MKPIIQKGFTLIEIILLIVIMGIMFTVAMKSMQPSIERARETATLEEMDLVAEAIIGNDNLIEDGIRSDYGYVGDIGSLPSTLDDLITRPAGYLTWNGPYLSAGFSDNPGDYKNDAWNQPYIYSGGVTIASTGGGNTISKKLADSVSELTANSLTGNIYDGLGYPPGDSASGIGITLYFPDGGGGNTSITTSPNAAGYFNFPSVVPIGNHLIRAIYGAANDTTSEYVSIPPASSPYCELRFQGNYWASGSSGGGAGLEYVSGSAFAYGSGSNTNNVEFQIANSSSIDTFTISWLAADFSTSPASYYGYVSWDGIDVWSSNPYNGPGDMALLTPQDLVPGQTVAIRIREFRRNQNGSGQKVNVNGVAFTITFSTGDVIDFVVP